MQNEQIDYSRKWYVMSAVGMGIFLATIDGSIVNVALPTLIRELDTTFPVVQWVVLAYLLTLSTLLLSMGRLGDMIGKKSIYATGFIVFTIGSVLCGLAPDIGWLIGFRVIQAIGGAMVFALGPAIVTEAFPTSERGKALGLSGTIVSIGIVVGPTLGGVIIEALSWHWIFLVNLPVGILGTIMVARFVPATKPPGGQKFDYWGGLTMFISLLAFSLALTMGQDLGFYSGRIMLLFGVWIAFLMLFLLIEWRTRQPMVELALFRNSLFSGGLATGFLTFVAIAGSIILIPFYLENVLGYSTRQVGLLLAVVPVALGIVSPISGVLSDRFGTRTISIIGLVALLVGYYAMSTLTAETTAWGYMLRLLPVGIGMGVFQSPNNSAIMGSVTPNRLGIASSFLAITRTLGQTAGIAVLGAFWASRVMSYTGDILPGGATAAPTAAQVAGLQQTFMAVFWMIVVALGLAVWGAVQARRVQQTETAAAAHVR